MASKQESLHSSLSIRLTESAVFVRSNENLGRRHAQGNSESQSSLLRGLLTMHLSKPTKISSIELQLNCNTSTSLPEGARRIDIAEEHQVFSQSTTFFRAHPQSRRHASVGPGIHPHDEDNNGDEWQYLHPATHSRDVSIHPPPESETNSIIPSRPGSATPPRIPRSQSCYPQELPPTPPYTPEMPSTSLRPSMSRNTSSTRSHENPAQTLEDFRNALRAGLNDHGHGTHHGSVHPAAPPLQIVMPAGSSSSSLSSFNGPLLSRRPSIEDVPEDELSSPISPIRHSAPHSPSSPSPSDSHSHDRHERRGRHHSRFSFASVSNVIFDAVRSKSPRMKSRKRIVSRDNSPEPHASPRPRGRAMVVEEESPHTHTSKSALSVLGGILRHDDHEHHDHQQEPRHWKMFKPGVYNYPVSFSIPGNAPPSLICPYGHVTWELKAKVRRPGTFTSNLTATQTVTVVTCPIEDDTEESENILVERQWESQLQYLISISGRSFYIGGTVPIHVALMPLAKIKVHRISVMIEEKTEYLSNMGRTARADPITRLLLLSVKNEGKDARQIFPMDSDNPDLLLSSPLGKLLSADDDVSEKAAEFMGPGPWTFHQDLKLPASCSTLTFTNKNKKSNILVSHSLKIVIRVERGDNEYVESSEKRKLFDIVIQAPVTLLSCRCNPEWTSLPRYTENFSNFTARHRSCPCDEKFPAVQRVESSDSSEGVEIVPVSGPTQSMIDQSEQFERLISGQETDAGEHPPTYESVSA